ncbi:aldo/keto reductase [Flavobacterium sp. PL02]|uniref:aldo/keto reductase n=1 Tax=Flavobacterium sp. PL02 TaxID=3088354 RepID=UPI002B2263F6|nr:aldo/keto reductase [Flavobacterium sp. PL02]MEA9413134.1 aldo/keto reductase [Flavobacterium sp. PL02]
MKNKIILGTVQMGLDYGINNNSGKISLENCCKILQKAYELGVDTLDTAEAYGNAHQVIGDFHKLNPKIKFNVITKIPHHGILKNIEQTVAKYIYDLHVESIETLMFHSFESYIDNKQILVVLKDLKSKGLIKHIGVSVYTNKQIEALLLDDIITVVQMPFNLLDNESVRGDLMEKLKNKSKVIHTRSAFLQGLFFKENLEDNYVAQKLSNELTMIKKIAIEGNVSISNLALSYCLSQKNINQVLIGVDSVNQLIDNLKSINYKISKETLLAINRLKVDDFDLLNPSLWK